MPLIVLRPALATVAIHALLLYLISANWSMTDRDVVRVKPVPKVINARLVDASEFKPKPQPKPAPVKKAEPKPQVKKPEPKPVVKPEPKPAPKAAPKPQPKPEPKPEPKPDSRPPEPRITSRELADLARAELASATAAENQAAEKSASFVALIQSTVINYWSRPPSARNGMETELAIQLIPTGEVVSVAIIRSSGNTAFDRSAVNAVQKAGAFPELQELDSAEFERTFRRFRLLFKPEDLRY
jgi:colicin import membrane protein